MRDINMARIEESVGPARQPQEIELQFKSLQENIESIEGNLYELALLITPILSDAGGEKQVIYQ